MDKIIVGGNVSGNVGSCEVKSTDVKHSFFKIETVAVNSCSGQIVADNTYTDWFGVALFGVLLFAAFIVGLISVLGAIFGRR